MGGLAPGDTVTAVAAGPAGFAAAGTTVTGDGFVLHGPAPAGCPGSTRRALGGPGEHEPTGVAVRAEDLVVLGLADGAPTVVARAARRGSSADGAPPADRGAPSTRVDVAVSVGAAPRPGRRTRSCRAPRLAVIVGRSIAVVPTPSPALYRARTTAYEAVPTGSRRACSSTPLVAGGRNVDHVALAGAFSAPTRNGWPPGSACGAA